MVFESSLVISETPPCLLLLAKTLRPLNALRLLTLCAKTSIALGNTLLPIFKKLRRSVTFLYQLIYFFLGGGVRGFVLSYCFCFVSSMFCWYLCSFVSYWCCVLALQLPLVLLSLHVNRYILNRFLVNKTNRCTEFQFYWYYDSTCFGQPFCPSSGVLSRTSAVVHFMQL